MFVYHPDLTGPYAKRYRKKLRIPLNPEAVAENADVLKDVLDTQFYVDWAERKKLVPQIKAASDIALDLPLKCPPFKHQKRAIAFILNTPSQGLFAEPGTGKTYCALVAAETRIRLGKCKKVLVICPASICRTGWYNDLKKFTDLTGVLVQRGNWRWNCPVCGKRANGLKQAETHKKRCGITEVDPELAWNPHKTVAERLSVDADVYIASINAVAKYTKEFLAKKFDFVILDESTMIKTPSSKSAAAVLKVGWSAKYRLALTGTPITNELEDIWTQSQFIDLCLDPTITKFQERYYWNHPTIPYIRKVRDGAADEVAEIMQNSVLKISKDECLDLPPRTSIVHEVPPSAEIKKVYKEFCAELFAIHKGEEVVAFNAFTEILRLQQILNGFWTKKDSKEIHIIDPAPPKLKEVKKIVAQCKNKVIVWARYRHDFRLLQDALADYHPAVCNGEKREVDKFMEMPECRVMIAHPKSARFGHTWNVADTTIYYTYGYSAEDYWQSRDRNYRIGQDKSVREIILSSGGIEDSILGAVQKKSDFAQEVMSNFQSAMQKLLL